MSRDKPVRRRRRSPRINGYDYSQTGGYFITICTKNRKCVLGSLTDEGVSLSTLGTIVVREWVDLPNRFANIELDTFVVMPNHVHGIITLTDSVGATLVVARNRAGASPAPTEGYRPRLGSVVGTFKSLCVHDWLDHIKQNGLHAVGKVWQRSYYDHIIRDEDDLNRIRQYVQSNPFCWESDRENPQVGNRATEWQIDEETWFSRRSFDD